MKRVKDTYETLFDIWPKIWHIKILHINWYSWMQKRNFELDFLWHRNLEQHESKSFGTAVNLVIESDICEPEVAYIKKKER